MKRVFRLVFTEQTVTDDDIVAKEKPEVIVQICEPEDHFAKMLVPDKIVSQTMLDKLYEGLKAEIENPNHTWKKKGSQPTVNEPTFEGEPIIIPLNKLNE